MKKIILELAVVVPLFFLSLMPVAATPLGRSNHAMDYMLKSPDLSGLIAGGYGGQLKREVDFSGSRGTTTLTSQRFTGYLGYGVLDWLSVYALAGRNETKQDGFSNADGEAVYGVGLSMNLLHHMIREPVPLEDVFRINAGVQALRTKSDFGFTSASWEEYSAALTFAIVNHSTGNKYYTPESIALYAGPAFSYFRSNAFSSNNNLGATGGMEIYFTDAASLDLRMDYFKETSFSVGVNFLF